MRRFLLFGLLACGLGGCNLGDRDQGIFSHHSRNQDTLVRDYVPTCNQPIMEAARAVTEFEDGLRRDGTITVKTPDVWGDSNLMHSIQEFDKELHGQINQFKETLQATVVVTDSTGVSVSTEAAVGLDGAPTVAAPTKPTLALPAAKDAFTALTSLKNLTTTEGKLSLEPTERLRQHATYVSLNQALRRRAMGGDNTRKAGYGLYMFRIPVSILPGEETSQGYSAVASVRARMKTTQADVKYTLPRMAIADLVEALAEGILATWNEPTRAAAIEKRIAEFKTNTIAKLAERDPKPDLQFLEAAVKDLAKDHQSLSDEQLENKVVEINKLLGQIALAESVASLEFNDSEVEDNFSEIYRKLRNPSLDIAELQSYRETISAEIAREKLYAQTVRVLPETVRKTEGGWETSSLGPKATSMLLERFVGKSIDDILNEGLLVDDTIRAADFEKELARVELEQEMFSTLAFVSPVSTPPSSKPVSTQAEQTGIGQLSKADFKTEDVVAVREYLKSRFKTRLAVKPQQNELRKMLFDALAQVNVQLDKIGAYEFISAEGSNSIQLAASELESGKKADLIGAEWRTQLADASGKSDYKYLRTAWLLARQCGLVDLNIKRMMREMQLRGDLTEQEVRDVDFINFFAHCDLPEAQKVWQKIVEKEFPLQVFTLEPLVEEQNLLDATSQLRQMQVALAYSVAQGGWNVGQRVELARTLAKETAAIGLNRTVVGFAHGMDTFGWYFNPRIQSPDTDIRNGRAFMQTLTNAGSSRKDDAKTYRLEPGIRECEVLVAMPSFVSQVEFDVTTNWESLANPGRSKRSYEELIQEGCKLQKMMVCLDSAVCGSECRPGDLGRLQSRAKQLENMLGMQTHRVNVPFEYDQPATELFDKGDRDLEPIVNGFYGLSTLIPKDEKSEYIADFFVTGRNFHPTLTHVIVAGHESHTNDETEPRVEILSRELIRVRTSLNTDQFAGESFEVRVGTPGGLSNPLSIAKKKKETAAPAAKKSEFDWAVQPKFTVAVSNDKKKADEVNISVVGDNSDKEFKIKSSKDNLIKITAKHKNNIENKRRAYRNSDLEFDKKDKGFELRVVYDATFDDKKTRKVYGEPKLFDYTEPITEADLVKMIKHDLEEDSDATVGLRPTDSNKGKIIGTTYIRLDNWPLIKLDTAIEIELK